MARLELHSRSPVESWDTDSLVIEYAKKFGHKQCCFGDLENYLSGVQRPAELIAGLETELVVDPEENADSVACKHILPFLLKETFANGNILERSKLL